MWIHIMAKPVPKLGPLVFCARFIGPHQINWMEGFCIGTLNTILHCMEEGDKALHIQVSPLIPRCLFHSLHLKSVSATRYGFAGRSIPLKLPWFTYLGGFSWPSPIRNQYLDVLPWINQQTKLNRFPSKLFHIPGALVTEKKYGKISRNSPRVCTLGIQRHIRARTKLTLA